VLQATAQAIPIRAPPASPEPDLAPPSPRVAAALRAVERRPADPAAWAALRDALHADGELDGAAHAAEQVMRTDPSEAAALAWAELLMHQGKPAQAAAMLAVALRHLPPSAPLRRARARAVRATGELRAAAEAWREALALDPEDADAHEQLAEIGCRLGDGDAALAHLRAAVGLRPGAPALRCRLAAQLEAANRLDEAEAELQAAMAAGPVPASAGLTQARLLRRRGEAAAALQVLDALRPRIEAEGGAPGAAARARWHADRGLCLDALDRPDAAFAEFVQKGPYALEAPGVVAAVARWEARTAAAAEATGAVLELARRPLRGEGQGPVFMFGFPRSGTTLIEQILGSHPALTPSDEANIADVLTFALPQIMPSGKPYPDGLLADGADPEARQRLRRAWARVQAQLLPGLPPGRRVIDKMPFNTFHIGLLALTFPESPMIMVLRDPRDTALSCLMQPFTANGAMGALQRMDDIVRTQERAYALWLAHRGALPNPWREVRYEALVDDLNTEAAGLLGWLGLPWDPAVARFYEGARDRVIRTASYAQVTQPIYRTARARWRRYEASLAPWLPRLTALASRLGYIDDTEHS
jgi:tetratricopeptide (TPR) repeat protein